LILKNKEIYKKAINNYNSFKPNHSKEAAREHRKKQICFSSFGNNRDQYRIFFRRRGCKADYAEVHGCHDVECWKIEIIPATKEIGTEYGYSKKVSWIGKTDCTARKNEFYDLDGRLLKVMMTEKVQLLDEKNKKYQPVDIVMDNKQNGRSSRIIMGKVIFNPNVKEEYFTTDYLQK
jgi:hypothetical protein